MEYGERNDVALGRGCAVPVVAGALAATLLVVASVVVELVTGDEREYLVLAVAWAAVICAAALVLAAFGWAGRADALPRRGAAPIVELDLRERAAVSHVDLMWRAGRSGRDAVTEEAEGRRGR